jgi:hypothetical protein
LPAKNYNAYFTQVTAVGHAAMLAAIQRYVPSLVYTSFYFFLILYSNFKSLITM